jgi:hypothetical protein
MTAVDPRHYKRWAIEPWDFIYANDLPFWMGNIIKYVMRYDDKDGLQDLKKARAYLDKKIKEMEATNAA